MRRLADASPPDGFGASSRALQSTFPARDDAPLALTLLRLLRRGARTRPPRGDGAARTLFPDGHRRESLMPESIELAELKRLLDRDSALHDRQPRPIVAT
jgi:hypothetical protein